jgi:hypothetical protein
MFMDTIYFDNITKELDDDLFAKKKLQCEKEIHYSCLLKKYLVHNLRAPPPFK